MEFDKEIKLIKKESIKNKIEQYTDDEVYEFLIKKMYKALKENIKNYFRDNPESNSCSIPIRLNSYSGIFDAFDVSDTCEYYKNDSPIYMKQIDSEYGVFEGISFRELCSCEYNKWRIFNNYRYVLTTLGARVISDLREKGKKEGIVVGEPYVYNKFGKKESYYKFGEWYSYNDAKSVIPYLPIKYELK